MAARATGAQNRRRSAIGSNPVLADAGKRAVVRLPRERRVKDIEAAARDAFVQNGYAKTAVSDIAARAGVAEGTIFTFFPSKRDLVIRVVELWYETMLQLFDETLPGIQGAENKMRFIPSASHRCMRILNSPASVPTRSATKATITKGRYTS